ncbi:hypothetical protein [Streptomyces lancefieldiae]|uniref:Uncharacterized protein n=1 Tax=Streptomyces lancefieldiae TaxID=3075520 RepID=A0ABU3B0B9_9ACTN|nr:hypothetical protein [Streptomyces sp. DSM 40712]MDT0615633.1 hypothetical protein [Streptomyces sp. DSM 40712]
MLADPSGVASIGSASRRGTCPGRPRTGTAGRRGATATGAATQRLLPRRAITSGDIGFLG